MTYKKYIKRPNSSIDADYRYYLAQEDIYTVLFGHKPIGYRKADYIWQALLKQYFPNIHVENY